MLPNHGRTRRTGDFFGHGEVKLNASERLVETSLMNSRRVGDPLDTRDKPIARAEGEVFVQVPVAINVDLGRKLAVPRGSDEKVHVRWPIAMSAHRLQKFFDLAAGRARVAVRHDRAEAIAAILIRLDTAPKVVSFLRRIEMRVIAHRVGVPYVHDGSGNRLA